MTFLTSLLPTGARAAAGQAPLDPADREHRAIYRELVEIDTSPEGGGIPTAVRAVERRLREAGFPAGDVVVDGPAPA